ncbi:TPA: hypothetical protein ACXP7I_003221 [Klebsiella variicola subsp. variicola]
MKITVQKEGELPCVEAKSKGISVIGHKAADLAVIKAAGIGNVRQLKSVVRMCLRELK